MYIFGNRGYDFDGKKKKRKKEREKEKIERGKRTTFSRGEKRKWRLPWPRATNPSSVRKSRERHGVEGRERETRDDDILFFFFGERAKKKKKNCRTDGAHCGGTRTCIMIVDNSVQDSFQYG